MYLHGITEKDANYSIEESKDCDETLLAHAWRDCGTWTKCVELHIDELRSNAYKYVVQERSYENGMSWGKGYAYKDLQKAVAYYDSLLPQDDRRSDSFMQEFWSDEVEEIMHALRKA